MSNDKSVRTPSYRDELKYNLKKLFLSYSAGVIDEHIAQAVKNNPAYEDFLCHLLDDELAHRKQSRIKNRLRVSTLRITKTMDSFDFTHPKSINQQLVKSLFDLNFIKEKTNVIILGPPGVGKTHIASALVYSGCLNDYKCRFTTAMNLINELNASLSDNSLLACMKRLISFDLLVIDELGYLPVDKQGSDLLFQIISNRYESGSIIITSNKPFKQWGDIFNGDTTVASAIIDRLVHHCEIIKIEGGSYRVKHNT